MEQIVSYIKLARVKQWIKNIFVLLPVVFSFQIFQPEQLGRTLLACLTLCLASSAVYAYNDALDYEEDRRHPKKRLRPVALGVITPRSAIVYAGILFVGSLFLGAWLDIRIFGLTCFYVVLNVAYSLYLKRIAYLDICCVALGFVVRMVVGAVAIHVRISFLLFATVFFLSLFMAAGKRGQELKSINSTARSTLGSYNKRIIWAIEVTCVAACCVLYTWWTIVVYENGQFPALILGTPAVVVIGFLAYLKMLVSGEYGDPTEIVYSSKSLQLIFLVYVALITVAFVAR